MTTKPYFGKINDRRSQSAGRDMGPARLPAIPRVRTGDAALDRFAEAVTERLEVREGTRGNDGDRVVTQRQLQAVEEVTNYLKTPKQTTPDAIQIDIGAGLTASIAIKKFEDMIRGLQLYKDLKRRLDDPDRFNDLPGVVRDELLRSLTEIAQKAGADVQQVERKLDDGLRSLAMRIVTVTAAVDRSDAAVREVMFAYADQQVAQAGKITQLQASLGNYYQDGEPGRANLEEQMAVTADRVAGLRSQYTLKVQAGKYLGGFGLAANENSDGTGGSAFIIAADKFAIVNPLTYSAGLTNTPDTAHIPFGVDANGIYLNHNVYVKGLMRIDAGGKTLADGMRGSLMTTGAGGTWSDNAARQAIWTKLGKAGSAVNNNHLVIGDMVTMGNTTKHWTGVAWEVVGVVINGNMLVDGSVSASKINANGLEVRDNSGNLILGSNVPIPASYLTNTRVNITGSSTNTQVTVNGQPMKVDDFVNILSKINASNIANFMTSAAIGSAYIGNAAIQNAHIATASIDTLQVRGGSVTTMSMGFGGGGTYFGTHTGAGTSVNMPAGSSGVSVMGTITLKSSSFNGTATLMLYNQTRLVTLSSVSISVVDDKNYTFSLGGFDAFPNTGNNDYYLLLGSITPGVVVQQSVITATGGKR